MCETVFFRFPILFVFKQLKEFSVPTIFIIFVPLYAFISELVCYYYLLNSGNNGLFRFQNLFQTNYVICTLRTHPTQVVKDFAKCFSFAFGLGYFVSLAIFQNKRLRFKIILYFYFQRMDKYVQSSIAKFIRKSPFNKKVHLIHYFDVSFTLRSVNLNYTNISTIIFTSYLICWRRLGGTVVKCSLNVCGSTG